LVALKLLIGINLRAFASERWSTMATREDEEELNGRKRDKIGVSDKEKASDEQTTALLSSSTFDARGAVAKGDKITLATLSRYDMVRSRLW
ncbi:hypothetical protein JCM1840_004484, partial [Sporobolomyces johnsonii]